MEAIETALAQFEQTVQALQRYLPDWDVSELTAAIEAARLELADLRLAPGTDEELLAEAVEDSVANELLAPADDTCDGLDIALL